VACGPAALHAAVVQLQSLHRLAMRPLSIAEDAMVCMPTMELSERGTSTAGCRPAWRIAELEWSIMVQGLLNSSESFGR